jgi:hypothetical protein
MATSSRTIFIALGVPTVASPSLVIFGSGSAGVVGAQRILTHPDGVNFAPINYYKNPTRTFNLDTEVLPAPISEAVRTLSERQVVRFERTLADVIVTEVWEGAEGSQASMPTYLFRWLYEYLRNPPPYSATAQTFITWQPRDRNARTYNVQLYRLTVGGGGASGGDKVFDIDDFRLPDSPEVSNPLENLDVTPAGLITRNVEMKLRIVSEVV